MHILIYACRLLKNVYGEELARLKLTKERSL